MPLTIIRNDITKMDVDAIVNAANTGLQQGGGVCGAIFNAAGAAELKSACNKLAPIKTGEAVITPGFKLPAKYIIHTAGPIYKDGKYNERELLESCYINSLKRAIENECESIAFPLISSGIFGYPKEEALEVAMESIEKFLNDNEIDVSLVVFDKEVFSISEKILGDVETYIDEHYVDESHISDFRYRNLATENLMRYAPKIPLKEASINKPVKEGIEYIIEDLDEPFSETLMRIIDDRGRTDVEVYKRANISRKLFSKIRTGKGYMPSKRTAIALAISLELNLSETDSLLECAGYALSHSQKFDVIIEYFIVNGIFDIYKINEILFKYDQPLLGG